MPQYRCGPSEKTATTPCTGMVNGGNTARPNPLTPFSVRLQLKPRTIAGMTAKGTYASLNLAAPDLANTFEQVQASGAEVVDPAGNLLRVQERR